MVVLVWMFADPPDRDVLAGLVLIGSWAAIYGGVMACLPGSLGGLVLAVAARVGLPRTALVGLGLGYGLLLGWFWIDVVGSILQDGPSLDQRGDLLTFRVGPALAGAAGAAWQALRTPLRQ